MAEDRVEPGEWVRALAERLGVDPPTDGEVEDLLSLAGTAAHSAERWVAPVSTWLVAVAGVPPGAARASVEQLADELAGATADPPRADPARDQ